MQEKLFTHIFVCMLYYYSYILVLTILSSNSSQNTAIKRTHSL